MPISSFLFRIGTATITALLIAASMIAMSKTGRLAGTQDAHLPVSSLHLPHASSDSSLAPSGATSTPSPCGLLWRQETDPSPSNSDILYSVAVVNSTDIWAVGGYDTQTLTEHWDGTVWTVVPSPNVGDMSLLRSVTAVATGDVWAVGYYNVGSNTQTLTEHWDGSQWHIVSSPSPGASTNRLWGVTAVTTNDVWAVGFYVTSEGHTLAEHWNGTLWTVVSTPYLQNSIFWGVTALAANDAWAVGESTLGKSYHAVTEHWNGSSWSVVPDDAPLGTQLLSVVAIATDDVWAVGSMGSTVTEHWDGTQWTLIPSPNVGVDDMLWGVAAASSADVWAVGSYRNGSIYPTLLEHWDGTQWTHVPGPSPDPSNNFLYGVAMLPSGEAWAVGSAGNGLIIHYSDPCVTPSPTLSPSRTATPTITLSASPTQSPTTAATTTITTSTPTSTPAATASASQTPGGATATAQATATSCTISFTDVPADNPFYTWIRCLACRGIISGYSDGSFKPGNEITRGQIAKMVSNAAGFSEDPGPQDYEDVPIGSPFYVYINRLSNRGYMGGYECGLVPEEPCVPPNNYPYFRPNASATRGQLAKIVANAAGLTGTPTGTFYTDVPEGHPFYLWIMRLTDLGVMSGYPCGQLPNEPCDDQQRPYFRPFNNVTRGQASKIVANTFFPDCNIPMGLGR